MTIRRYENRDYEAVKRITLASFSLDSFHVDPFFTKDQSDRIIWEIWTEPAVTNGRNRCFVCESGGELAGFAVFGGMKELGKILGKKIGTLIILAVDERFRHTKEKTGTTLVRFMTDFFRKAGAGLVTVGTDSDNGPALKCYSTAGFFPVLEWSTFRHYSDLAAVPLTESVIIDEIPDVATMDRYFNRPIPFLHDSRLAEAFRTQTRAYYISALAESLDSRTSYALKIGRDSGMKGYAVIQEEKAISGITGRSIWRINDILSEPQARPVCLESVIAHLADTRKADVVEFFSASDNQDLISDLTHAGFRKTHDAMTLHLHYG